jgi:hypothetical protein|tara:strand:- start:338 stop:1024 length:687 start_codon:yes stop_codon:yes gene_type:complete
MKNIFYIVVAGYLISSCSGLPIQTKAEAYPAMYDDRKPLSVLVIPAINNSTAAEATDFFNVTITEPLSNVGYYTMPVEIVKDIFQKEGIVDSTMIKGLPTSIFKKNFGADAVLFVTINKWDKQYVVIAGNVSVSMDYVMLSTETSEVIWSYSATQTINTTAESSGFIMLDILSTAITTATTDYVPIAKQVNYQAFTALPHGGYSDQHGLDQDQSISTTMKDAALEEDI